MKCDLKYKKAKILRLFNTKKPQKYSYLQMAKQTPIFGQNSRKRTEHYWSYLKKCIN